MHFRRGTTGFTRFQSRTRIKIEMKRFIVCLFFQWFSSLAGQTAVLEKTILFGNVLTRDGVVLRELRLKKGQASTAEQLAVEKAWFLRLNYFKRVELETRPVPESGRRALILVVQEKSPWSFDPILSQNEPFGWILGGTLGYNNLFGRHEKAALLLQTGAVNCFSFSLQEPWFLGAVRMFSGLEAYHKQFRYVYDDHAVHFFEKDQGVRLTIGKSWGRVLQTGMTAGVETVNVSDPSANASNKKREQYNSLEPFIQFDSRDWPTYPFTGMFCRIWKTWNATPSHDRFSRVGLDSRIFITVLGRHVLAFQAAAAISEGPVPVVKRLHIGGSNTLRGLDDWSVSGENSLMTTLEYRLPILFEKNNNTGFRFGYAAVVFADMGAGWYQREVLNRDRLLGSVGFGFHAILDRLVVRLEWGTRGKGLGFITTGTGVKF